jgi:hypothetical protein
MGYARSRYRLPVGWLETVCAVFRLKARIQRAIQEIYADASSLIKQIKAGGTDVYGRQARNDSRVKPQRILAADLLSIVDELAQRVHAGRGVNVKGTGFRLR